MIENNLKEALENCINQMEQAQKLVDCSEFNEAINTARSALVSYSSIKN